MTDVQLSVYAALDRRFRVDEVSLEVPQCYNRDCNGFTTIDEYQDQYKIRRLTGDQVEIQKIKTDALLGRRTVLFQGPIKTFLNDLVLRAGDPGNLVRKRFITLNRFEKKIDEEQPGEIVLADSRGKVYKHMTKDPEVKRESETMITQVIQFMTSQQTVVAGYMVTYLRRLF